MLFSLELQIGMAHSLSYVVAGLCSPRVKSTRPASTCLARRELSTKLTEAPRVGHGRDIMWWLPGVEVGWKCLVQR